MELDKKHLLDLYRTMQRIRQFETKAGQWFAEGDIPGFVHLYLGEEAVATGACDCLNQDDYITSTHRGHGHVIAKGGELKYVTAELFGKATGYNHGKGGSMHIANSNLGILGANGIVGAGHCLACGAGLSAKVRGTKQVCICFFGDASTNQGTFHESLNLASVWDLPVVFVCENNGYGVSTSQARSMRVKDVAERAAAYGMPSAVCDGNDVLAVRKTVMEAVERARNGGGPTLVECKTWRHGGHFAGDPGAYKPAEEQKKWLEYDPITNFRKYAKDNKVCSVAELDKVDEEVRQEMEAAYQFACDSPYPDAKTAVEDVYTDIVEEARVR